ncbi:hypothetical protein AALO_G00027010 [Alosa alosa]|uniref:APC membrane recruitment protein 1 n=1 Tax=Alosa alosa TaxID=278164 RepID=A0AAV6HEK7_9TELE|nr:APC membrane recruitment protein 1 [Alosa alosa]XP_048093638.1 APC membrane recruitment protein 1 [Alosa alosa]XP_048093639.1 APC membrane recruitment protein 1 [Alosa alosa]XP_048093640.1 APC membrane recruitment protein 1 [Alosa alosa]KAG5284465.1 hypothetical protein AALO_G00027010 [Alosa alosa]
METGAGSELSEAEIVESISQESPHPPPQPPSGKLRKTAFKFFSSRKSICVLPSFFGGLGKGQSRGSSKSGVTKSRTHDGVSRGCWDDGVRGSGDIAAGDFEFRAQRDCGGGAESQRGTGETLKSQFLPWQRRGLRGLFSSIRRHKRSKNVEKISSLEMLPSACNVPVAQVDTGRHSSSDDGRLGSVLEPVVPDSANGREGVVYAAAECMKADVLVPEMRTRGVGEGNLEEEEEEEVGEKRRRSGVEAAAEETEVIQRGVPGTYRQPLCADSELVRLAEQNPEGADCDPPAASSSSDHASLVFGDVASLKSFDSLTGCGDIIADQDDDSVAESSVSGERGSRNAGKRSSCFVSYQGGGEEMATPDEVDGDYLQGLWEAEAANEACYVPDEHSDDLPITPDQPISSLHTITTPTTSSSDCGGISSNTDSSPLGVLETVLSPGDLMTPQSDHQESVPNSDEGYYDSTTPGADDDARERPAPRPERLPRDSYSGDALYELFEPDDRLLSPALAGDGDPCDFLGMSLPGSDEGKGSPIYSLKTGAMDTRAMETEEVHLTKIQQALLCCELQSLRTTGKDPLLFNRGPYYTDSDLPLGSCKVGKKHLEEPLSPRGTRLAPVRHALEDASLSSDGGSGPQMQDNPTYSQIPSPLQESGPYLQRDQCSPPAAQPHGLSLPSGGHSQEELTVCFSQALVDFTKRSRVYCNSTESLDGSESSSPFGQNLQALPTIVTFDVVDMENEGEFEQQTEEGVEEELASPFEPFEPFEDESCYLQKDAFAECDERLFDAYEQSLLLDNNAWGITSLPRHLSSGRASQTAAPPLALNRRSRSLDTDSLELCASSDAAATAGGTPYETARTASSLHRKKKNAHVSGAPGQARGGLNQQPAATRDGRRHGHGQGLLEPVSVSNSVSQKQPSACPPPSETHPASKPALQAAIRPSDLPLQAAPSLRGRNPAGASAGGNGAFLGANHQSSGEGLEVFYRCGLAESGHSQGKMRPVGVTQGVPHLCPSASCSPWARSDKERALSGKSMKAVEVGYGGPTQSKRST